MDTVTTYRIELRRQTAEYIEALQAAAAEQIIQICLMHDQRNNCDKALLYREVFKVMQAVVEEISSVRGF